MGEGERGGRKGREGERERRGREGGEGGRAGEREREVDETWMERRGCHIVPLLAHVDSPHCPRQQRDYFLEKKKFRLISGHFEKFGLIRGTFEKVQTFL